MRQAMPSTMAVLPTPGRRPARDCFFAAGEDVEYAADFLIATDDGVEFARFGAFVEVDAEFAECVVGIFGALLGHFAAVAQFEDGFFEGLWGGAAFFEQPCALVVAQQDTQQHQFDRDKLVAKFGEHLLGFDDGVLRFDGKIIVGHCLLLFEGAISCFLVGIARGDVLMG
jgi:hypothetical protein